MRNIFNLIEAENVESDAPNPGTNAGVHAYPTGILRESPVADTMIVVFYAPVAADRGRVKFNRAGRFVGDVPRDVLPPIPSTGLRVLDPCPAGTRGSPSTRTGPIPASRGLHPSEIPGRDDIPGDYGSFRTMRTSRQALSLRANCRARRAAMADCPSPGRGHDCQPWRRTWKVFFWQCRASKVNRQSSSLSSAIKACATGISLVLSSMSTCAKIYRPAVANTLRISTGCGFLQAAKFA